VTAVSYLMVEVISLYILKVFAREEDYSYKAIDSLHLVCWCMYFGSYRTI